MDPVGGAALGYGASTTYTYSGAGLRINAAGREAYVNITDAFSNPADVVADLLDTFSRAFEQPTRPR